MTIDEAILELQDGLRALRGYLNEDYNKAIDLGIEALKRCKGARKKAYFTTRTPLPGETEK